MVIRWRVRDCLVGDGVMNIVSLDVDVLDLVVLLHQLRLYVEKHGEHSFEGRYAELLIDMIVLEIEKKK